MPNNRIITFPFFTFRACGGSRDRAKNKKKKKKNIPKITQAKSKCWSSSSTQRATSDTWHDIHTNIYLNHHSECLMKIISCHILNIYVCSFYSSSLEPSATQTPYLLFCFHFFALCKKAIIFLFMSFHSCVLRIHFVNCVVFIFIRFLSFSSLFSFRFVSIRFSSFFSETPKKKKYFIVFDVHYCDNVFGA